MAADYPRPWTYIANDLRAKILAGRWQPGDRLPTLAQLSVEYRRARGTVQNAINLLRDEGLIETRGSSGIYVLPQQGDR